MGSIFSSAVPDGPYAYKFTGFALWLLLESQDLQAVIDTMNPSPWRAHSTLGRRSSLRRRASPRAQRLTRVSCRLSLRGGLLAARFAGAHSEDGGD